MPGIFSSLNWALAHAPRGVGPWTLDRDPNRAEAERHFKSGNYTEAERFLLLAVQDSEQKNRSATKRVRLLLELAEVQRRVARTSPASPQDSPDQPLDAAKLSEAEHTIRAAVLIAARASASESYLQCQDALIEIFEDQHDYPAMETAAQEAIRLGAALAQPDPLGTARRAHWLGVARYQSGRVEEALPALEKSLALYESHHGPDHLVTTKQLSELGRIYRALGQHPKAQEYLRRALRVHAAEFGPDSPQAFGDLAALAGSLEESGHLEEASKEYERALMLKRRKLGVANMDEVAEMQFSLANIYIGWDNLTRARELLTDSIGTFRHGGGPRLAVALEVQAQLEERAGRYYDAVRDLEKAGTAWRKSGRIAELVNNMEYRADLLQQLRKTTEAAWLREQAVQLLHENPQATAGTQVPTPRAAAT